MIFVDPVNVEGLLEVVLTFPSRIASALGVVGCCNGMQRNSRSTAAMFSDLKRQTPVVFQVPLGVLLPWGIMSMRGRT